MPSRPVSTLNTLSLPLLISVLMGTSPLASAKMHTELPFELKNNSIHTALNGLAPSANIINPLSTSTNIHTIQLAKNDKITKSTAANAAKKKYGGKVLKVSENGNDFRVKLLLDNGRVKIVNVETASGKVD